MTTQRWTDDFLDDLRQQGDPPADDCFAALWAEGVTAATTLIFKQLCTDDAELPADAPAALVEFFHKTDELPTHADMSRIQQGESAFMTHALPAALIMLAKSLPSGYAAPCLAKVLALSGDLEQHPYKRLLGVLQLVVNVASCREFSSGGRAVVTAQKLRLLHAGVRHITRQNLPDYEVRYGVPVNQEDMLATIMGFSYLVIEGLRQLNVGLSPSDEEDVLYLWCLYAQMMGMIPEAVPASVADAEAFYQAYARRHFVGAADNPDGCALAVANLHMMEALMPRWLRMPGLKVLPRIYMQELIGPTGCARVGIQPVTGHNILKRLLGLIPGLWLKSWHVLFQDDYHLHEAFSQMIFQNMIDRDYNGQVTFAVPATLAQLRAMV